MAVKFRVFKDIIARKDLNASSGSIAQSVEHRTNIAEVMGSDPVGASEFFLGFICNYLSYFTTVKISFTSILYPQFTHMIFIIYTSYSLHIHGCLDNVQKVFSLIQFVSCSL